jgi:Asp-tRNA(Asn)/Glu-tRNA(Gln) amidotransferase A subunit family amidase
MPSPNPSTIGKDDYLDTNESLPDNSPSPALMDRRQLFTILAAAGVGTACFQRALAAQASQVAAVTPAMVKESAWIADLELSEEEINSTTQRIQNALRKFRSLRSVPVGYDVPPALYFSASPLPTANNPKPNRQVKPLPVPLAHDRPEDDRDLAFLPVFHLAELMRTGQVTSMELTKLYLQRLKKYDAHLHCVVTLTEDLALKQAQRADKEIAAGKYRGPLHGIPWGAKDLIAYPPYKTSWGAPYFKDQVLADKATVAQRLDAAGAVLVAKLSLGALAMGDRWYGGMTRNPWKVTQGSSGSSAGSGSATAAGLVGFSLGSETLGSIISPSRRCGTSGLRPTFGRVSRHGCMSLAWSMDKIGPITRSVEDCALILAAIHGADGKDPTAVDRPFEWPATGKRFSELKIGYFETETPAAERDDLAVLRKFGVQLVPIQLPDTPEARPLTVILDAEAATVFDELTRKGITEGLNSWPNTFRQGQFIPAVEYLRANRVRTLLMRQMANLMKQVDAYIGGDDLVITNFTGHPTVVMPDGFRQSADEKVPYSVTFTGQLFGEAQLLTIAQAYQQERGYHLEHPSLLFPPVENQNSPTKEK